MTKYGRWTPKHPRTYIRGDDPADKKPYDTNIMGEKVSEEIRYQEYWNTGIWDPRWQDDDYYNMRWEHANPGETDDENFDPGWRTNMRRKMREQMYREEGEDVDHPEWQDKLDELDEIDLEDEMQERFDHGEDIDDDYGY